MADAYATEFYIQEMLLEVDVIALYCTACGGHSEANVGWVAARGGDQMGCHQCGRLGKVPFLNEIGV